MTAPTPGRIVHYRLSSTDAEAIIRDRETYAFRKGNGPGAGDLVPMIVVRAWDGDGELVNGQALLDGNDALWVCSAGHGGAPGQWHWHDEVFADPELEPEPELEPVDPEDLAALKDYVPNPPTHPVTTTTSTATVSTAIDAAGDGHPVGLPRHGFDVVGT